MDIHSKEVTNLPHHSGVYLYKDRSGTIIYIGKAIDIQKRVKQYFDNPDRLSVKTQQLVSHIHSIDCITTVSEFDAILLEASLISSNQPKYNMIAKDDKSPIYIHIPLNDTLPIISLTHKPKMSSRSADTYIGPFQTTRIARQMLRLIRTVIPYCRQKVRKGKPCFYTHLGLCHPCPSEIMADDPRIQKERIRIYRNNVFLLRDVLNGKSKNIRIQLEREMVAEAKKENFERASYIRNQLQQLDRLTQTHFDPSLYTSFSPDIGETIELELEELKTLLKPFYPKITDLKRIECVDISQLDGDNAVGSLVVLDNGIINTSLYRKFAIKHVHGQNDFKMIQEVLERRFHHKEWEFPNLLIIDGGKSQVMAAFSIINSLQIEIPIIGIAKRFERIIIRKENEFKELYVPITAPAMHCVQRLRDESHRFAHKYHVTKRKKAYLPKI